MNERLQANHKIILGLKVRELRLEKNLSLTELGKQAGLSVSYLNEIEKGKKSPKEDKLEAIAEALGTNYEALISTELPAKLEPLRALLQSNFLNDLPLELFQIELNKIIEIIANAPAQVSAFISTLIDLSRNYAVQQDSFYFAALRSYLELHSNYFEELEQQVDQFATTFGLSTNSVLSAEELASLLEEKFHYVIVRDGLDTYPDLKVLRSVFIPKDKKLLLNSELSDMQRAFQFGKELGFNYLKLKERANTSSVRRPNSFQEVLNHSKAIYFSTALLLNRKRFIADVKDFFSKPIWEKQAFLNIMHQHKASPEMYYHRLTSLLPQFFNLKKLFFIRFIHNLHQDTFEIDRDLHLGDRNHANRNEMNEHYCRRWIAVHILQQLKQYQLQNGKDKILLVDAQRIEYHGTGDEYLCLTIARNAYPSPNKNVSVTIALLINKELREQIKFWNDPEIPRMEINKTCERCAITDCKERVAPPTVLEKKQKQQKLQQALAEIIQNGH